MALFLSSGGIRHSLGGFGARSLIHRADEALGAVRTSEVALSAFGFGVLQGRFKSQGGLTLLSLPVDLLAGAVFHVMAVFDFARPYKKHLHAVADGALASFFTTMGYRVGERAAASGSLMKGLSGMFGDDSGKEPAGGSSIAEQELAKLVRGGK